MTETYTFTNRYDENRCYSYDPVTGNVTNHDNGKVVNIGKGTDFTIWLKNIGAFNVKKIN